jgi:histidinol-phosphate aminotransferase
MIKTRERLQGRLQRMGLKTMESEANFVFVRFPSEQGASSTYQALLQKGLLVRYFPQMGLSDGLRISIGTDHETDRLLNELQPLVEKAMK